MRCLRRIVIAANTLMRLIEPRELGGVLVGWVERYWCMTGIMTHGFRSAECVRSLLGVA